MIKAVIFDMDGVLMDTKEAYYKAAKKLFEEEYGKTITRKEYNPMFGIEDRAMIKHFLKKFNLKGDVEELRLKKREMVQLQEKGNLKLFPGAKELVKTLSKNYKLALTSSTWKIIIKNALDEFGMRKYFKAVVGKEDVKKHKPDPEPYLVTAKKLKVKPSECVVVEDSISGVEAGKNAGMKVIAVMTSYTQEKLRKADLFVNNVKQIRIGQFRKL
jgi:HAD superfamily hydrolase (TIGR01509 family)